MQLGGGISAADHVVRRRRCVIDGRFPILTSFIVFSAFCRILAWWPIQSVTEAATLFKSKHIHQFYDYLNQA